MMTTKISSKLLRVAMLAFVSLGLSSLEASADQHMKDGTIPNLIGTWSGKNNTISDKKGYLTRDKTIEITEQKDRRFKGIFKYAEGTVKFFGVIYPDNLSFTWVSEGSRGYNQGRILGKSKISACYVESGIDATAGCAELTRQ